AVEALRDAVAAVDGRHARRRAYGGALPLPADAARLRSGLTEALASDPARADDLAVSLAVVAWLSGDAAGALAAVAPVADRGGDADALALRARVLLGQGQAPGALAAVNQALALRPKEVAWQLVRGEALLAVGRTGEAESALAAARSGAVPASSLHLFAARVAAKKGDTAGALVARKAAVAADPTDLVARRALRGVTED
ncbi:MAG: tetratricopeptide repeat protein, partial [Myxococcota bacterium]